MKIQLMSDMHFEFGWRLEEMPVQKDTTLILAGDIDNRIQDLELFLYAVGSKYERVIMVAGNHEFYGNDIIERLTELRNIGPDNFFFMEDNILRIEEEKVLIIGATLWSDPNWGVFHDISDHYKIRHNNHRLLDSDIREFNAYSTDYIKHMLEKDLGLGWRKVVVTHFGPDNRLMNPRWLGQEQMNSYFWASGFQNHFHMASHWLFGHTHDTTNMVIDGCKCIANPHGYVWRDGNKEHYNFDYNLILEV